MDLNRASIGTFRGAETYRHASRFSLDFGADTAQKPLRFYYCLFRTATSLFSVSSPSSYPPNIFDLSNKPFRHVRCACAQGRVHPISQSLITKRKKCAKEPGRL